MVLIRSKFKKNVNSQVNIITGAKSDQDLLEDYFIECSWPKIYYSNLANLAKLTQGRKILEIGVAYGYHAEYILENVPDSIYTGIDPYQANYDADDAFSRDVATIFNDEPQAAMNRLHQAVSGRLRNKYDKRFNILRNYSMDALEELEGSSYDLIFIDGDHRYETVSRELPEYWSRVSKGGILAGDDYEWSGVAKAVDEFASKNGLETIFISNTSRGYPTYFFHKV